MKSDGRFAFDFLSSVANLVHLPSLPACMSNWVVGGVVSEHCGGVNLSNKLLGCHHSLRASAL